MKGLPSQGWPSSCELKSWVPCGYAVPCPHAHQMKAPTHLPRAGQSVAVRAPPRGGGGGAGRRVRGARIEQVLEQYVARVLYSDRPRLEHTEPSLPGHERSVGS